MTDAAPVGGCEDLAARWLDAEERALAEPTNDSVASEAADLGEAYELAVRGASAEDLRLALEAARRTQEMEEIGGPGWAKARRVAELLRTEYEATRGGSRLP